MPDTPLTKILHEFRAYRPLPHRQFLAHVASKAEQLGVKDFSVRDKETVVLYLKVLDHVRSFRWRHWLFAREYIIRRSPHPTATGGSPIITVRNILHYCWCCSSAGMVHHITQGMMK
jgi:indoleamine 2,3-dioxygenase